MTADPSLIAGDVGRDASRLEQLALGLLDPPATGPGAPCGWCGEPIPAFSPDTGRRTRRDATFCGVVHRQASWRFGHHSPAAPPPPDDTEPRRFAYADPPYPGMSWRYYRDHPDYAGEVDHAKLLEQLVDGYPDGWALSTSSKTLRMVLALVPADVDVRIAAWTKPMPPTNSRAPVHGWEPVVWAGGRAHQLDAPMLLDWHYAAPPRRLPGQVTGTKPSSFSAWVFQLLGAQAGDQLDDLFPGSGAVARAWERYVSTATSGV